MKPGSTVRARGNAAATARSPAPAQTTRQPRPGDLPTLATAAGIGLPVARDHGLLVDEDPLPFGASTERPTEEFQEIPRRDPVLPRHPLVNRDGEEIVPAFDGNVDGPSIGAPPTKPGELAEGTDYVDVLPKSWVRQSGRGAVELEDDD